MFVIQHKKIFYLLSIVLIAISIVAVSFWGLRPGIDFTGGSLLNVDFGNNIPDTQSIESAVSKNVDGEISVRQTGESGYIIRTKEITQEQKNQIIKDLSFGDKYSPTEKTFSSIGPILGKEAIYKSWISIILVLLAIVLFVAFAFRKVSKPISSWIYGLVTILALAHDVIIPTGAFAILGHFYGFEVDTLFVTALLVILGFSVHDTIVVFDRVRENLHKNEEFKEGKSFETVVGESISQTFVRSINTSLTTLLAILVLYILGPESIKHFSLTLLIGISVGTYSSIFIGSPLLVTINNRKQN